MSVFHVFYLAPIKNKNFEQLKRLINEIIQTISKDNADGKLQIYENTDALLGIGCEYFALSVRNSAQHFKFKSEDYGLDFQYQLWFDAYTAKPDWFEGIISFAGKLLKVCNCDCVLEANGDTPLIMRKKYAIIIDSSKLSEKQMLLFDDLGIEYQEGLLKSV